MLSNDVIMAGIRKREERRDRSTIATREERQDFWTEMMKNAERDSDKLKASELLGKPEADFTDKHIVDGSLTLEEKLKDIRE